MLDDEADGLARLRQVLGRVGVEKLVQRPGLARNVFADTFPDDPLAASLLTVAVEHGTVRQLQEQTGSRDLGIDLVAPRLAAGLASSRGIVPEHARWAVDTWALALGLTDRSPQQADAGSPPGPEAGEPEPTRRTPGRTEPPGGPDPGAGESSVETREAGSQPGRSGRSGPAADVPTVRVPGRDDGPSDGGSPGGSGRPTWWGRYGWLTIAAVVLVVGGLAYALYSARTAAGDASAGQHSAATSSETAGSAAVSGTPSSAADSPSPASGDAALSPRAESSSTASSRPSASGAGLSKDEQALYDSLPTGLVEDCVSNTAAHEFEHVKAELSCSAAASTTNASEIADGVTVVLVTDDNIHSDVRRSWPGTCPRLSDGNWSFEGESKPRGAISCEILTDGDFIAWSFDDRRTAVLANAKAGVSQADLMAWWRSTPTPWD